jgi:Mrp family chromosome partitioning ATPase
LVVCDTPALIGAGGATPLLSRVDACIVIARLGVLDRSSLAELARISEPPAAPALGFVTVEGKPRPARERRGTGGRVGVAPLGLDPERSW